MSEIVPDKVLPASSVTRTGIRPVLSPREIKIISALSKCGAAYRSTIERFWHPLKGRQKIQSLLRWGILWSYRLGESEIVTLSPTAEELFGVTAYFPADPREALKKVLASEIYIKALQKGISCEWEPGNYPLQGVINIGGNRAGILVLLRGENTYLGVKIRCFVICEDEEHIKTSSRMISFPALYTTPKALAERNISEAFCDANLKPVRLALFA
ncbi:MAG: hypothetical protein ACPLTR_12350 [Thermacetogeniaceae bacterium]